MLVEAPHYSKFIVFIGSKYDQFAFWNPANGHVGGCDCVQRVNSPLPTTHFITIYKAKFLSSIHPCCLKFDLRGTEKEIRK